VCSSYPRAVLSLEQGWMMSLLSCAVCVCVVSQEAVSCYQELASVQRLGSGCVSVVINHVVEKCEQSRQQAGTLLLRLITDQLISVDQFVDGSAIHLSFCFVCLTPVCVAQWSSGLSVRTRRLSFFGHLHRADPRQDHHRALEACIMDPPGDWRRRAGRPRQSWLRTVEADLRPMNLGLATAKRRAQDRSAWRLLVATATSSTSS